MKFLFDAAVNDASGLWKAMFPEMKMVDNQKTLESLDTSSYKQVPKFEEDLDTPFTNFMQRFR